jgi:large subunit ribosomal protein L31/Ran GTPase-activating protein 1
MADHEDWFLSEEQRAETVRRVAENIASLAFTRGVDISDSRADELAAILEKKAYNVARVESRTTTGVRPANESLRSYTRHAMSFLLPCKPRA